MITKSVLSQDGKGQKNIVSGKYAVTLMPAFFPYNKMGLQAGFQFKIRNMFAFMNEIAFPITKASENGGVYQKMQILKFTTDFKYYPKESIQGRFYSLQLGYIQRNFADKDSGIYHNPGAFNETGYSRLTIKSPAYFFALKWGRELVELRKTFLDCFLGMGIRIIPTKYEVEGIYITGQSEPRDNIAWMVPIPAWEYDKTIVRPHISVGLRIGRKF